MTTPETPDEQHLRELAAWLREHRWGPAKANAIDALLARLTAAEAENKRHRGANLIRALMNGADPEWIAEAVSAETFDVIPWRIADRLRARLTAAEAIVQRAETIIVGHGLEGDEHAYRTLQMILALRERPS